ncbi:MAG TPA: hypothetical protein VIF10_12445 [Methylobacter sp.]|jgi:hypothetical protein
MTVVNGWGNYCHYQVMEKVKTHTEQRLRKNLMKPHKVKDREVGEGREGRFSDVERYRFYGVYKIPAEAGARRMLWREEYRRAVCRKRHARLDGRGQVSPRPLSQE